MNISNNSLLIERIDLLLPSELFYSGEAASSGQVQAFTCPFCGNLGYSEVTLYEHVNQEHSDSTVEVVS